MELKEPLPEPLQQVLEGLKEPDEETLIATSSDVSAQGSFGQEWLVFTNKRILVFGEDSQPRLVLPLSEIKEVTTENLVGGGVLQASINGHTREIVRYSNSISRKIAVIARSINTYAREGHLPPPSEEDLKPLVCKRCGHLLPEWSEGLCPHCLKKTRTLARIFSYAWPYKGLLLASVVVTFLQLSADLIPPYLNKILLDGVFGRESGLSNPERLRLLGLVVLAMAGLRLAGTGLSALRGFIMAWLGARVTADIRRQVYQLLQRLQLRFYDRKQTGNLISRVANDTNNLHWLVVDMIPEMAISLLQLVGVCVILFRMNWQLTLLVLLPTPLIMVTSLLFMRRIHKVYSKTWHLWGKMHEVINNALSGIRIVKAFAQEEKEVERFERRNSAVFSASIRAEQTWAVYWPGMSFLIAFGGFLVWYFGGRSVIYGNLTVGTLMAFVGYLWMIYGPAQWLPRLNDWISRSLTAAERVFEILDGEPEVYEDPEAVPMPYIRGEVEFRNVTFGYHKHQPVLQNISFKVKPGQMVGLVGHSGAGKSTTINLICRFYDVDEGQILIDGVDIRKIRLKDLRSQIGMVPQDCFLFAGTIAENIAYGKEDATREEIIAAAIAANAHDFIMNLPDGYDTQVGERGQNLSGGERQRIAIARAILNNPRILILDEATSSVDTEAERQIQEALKRLTEGRTTFAIAHRLSTLRNADYLLVLDHGRVVEHGTHDELMAKQGVYYRLVNLQAELSKLRVV